MVEFSVPEVFFFYPKVLAGVIRAFDLLNAAAEVAADTSSMGGGIVAVTSGSSSSRDLLSVQGTVLLHFDSAMRQV